MSLHLTGAVLFTLPALALSEVRAQETVPVLGIVFDSLRGVAVKGAIVAVDGSDASATTDERGKFSILRVPVGVRTFTVQHASLDSIGFSGMARRHTVAPEPGEIRLALPSFATLWKAACGGEPPADSGFVYGTIRHSGSRSPVANAHVEVSWIVTTYDKAIGIRQRRVSGRAVTNSNGNYVACGVPTSHWIRVSATAELENSSAQLPPRDLRVARRDLLIGPDPKRDPDSRGTIVGRLVDQDGSPYSEARILLDDSTEIRSDGDGQFAFANVRSGTHQLEILSIGMAPIVTTVDVYPGDSAAVRHELRRVTTLDVVRVTASRRGQHIAQGLEDRRKRGLGTQMDMAQLQAYSSFRSVLNDFPGVRVVQKGAGDYGVFLSDGRGGQCSPEVWVDGARQMLASLTVIRPQDVTAVEFYPRASSVPIEFRRTEQDMTCGAILVWTNWAFSR